jgi:hypothetical protein
VKRRLIIAAVAVIGSACSRSPRHPTAVATEGLPAKVSQPVEFVLASTVGAGGTLLSARVVHPSPGLHVVNVGLNPSNDVANGEPYPPQHPVIPLPADYHGPQPVAIAIRADSPGNYDALGVVLTWRSDGEIRTAYQAMGLRLCVGAKMCDSSSVMKKIERVDIDEILTVPIE